MSAATAPAAQRFAAVDMLRGLTIGFMILANNNGGERAFGIFRHADWNGFTPTDLVFPTFLFLVGVSIAYSTAARLGAGAGRAELFGHALRRGAILFLLGIVVNGFPFFHLDTMRCYGVLQRIAICYVLAVAVHLASPGWRGKLGLVAALLIGYWALMRFAPVPGLGVPGRDVPLLDPDANLAAWLDRAIFPAAHLYERTRDPEGLLSTLPALATTLIGLLSGGWLRSGHTAARKTVGIALAGVACVALGALWNFGFPINKKLWTSSYVLYAGGWSLLLLAGFLCLDLRNAIKGAGRPSWWRTLLLAFGTNAIVAYMVSELLASALWAIPAGGGAAVQNRLLDFAAHLTPSAAVNALLYALAFVAASWLVVYVLYRRRLFIRI